MAASSAGSRTCFSTQSSRLAVMPERQRSTRRFAAGNVDAQIDSLEASYVALPWGEGFEIFTGLGVTDLDVDAHVNNPDVDLTKSTLSLHVGVGYRAMLGSNLYVRPEVRARVYDAGDNTIDFTASIALGWRWDND